MRWFFKTWNYVSFPVIKNAFDAINLVDLIYNHFYVLVLIARIFVDTHVNKQWKVTVLLRKEYKWQAAH